MGFFAAKETDPVCKMKVDPKTGKETFAWEGKTYYFCSASCKESFAAQPARYLAGGSTRGPM